MSSDGPLRIALVLGTLELGGTESQACRLAVEFLNRDHSVKVFVLGGRGPLADYLESNSVPWESFGYAGFSFRDESRHLRPWKALPPLRKIITFWRSLRNFRPHVCHAYLLSAFIFGMVGAFLTRVPVRVSARRGLSSTPLNRKWYGLARSLSNRFASVIVANSECLADDVSAAEGVERSRIRVIPNGVDLAHAAAHVASTPSVGLVVANLLPYKGHQDILSALSMMLRPPQLRFIGDGRERERIERRVSALGLSDQVIVEGSRIEARALYQEVQFGVLASHEEGLPNALLEAMAAGIPVVATSVGGIPELVEDNVNGLLVPPQDPRRLAHAIDKVASDPALRLRLGKAARETAAQYTWHRCTDAHEALYRSLLGSPQC